MIVLIESDKGGKMHVYNQVALDRHLALGWRILEIDNVPVGGNVVNIQQERIKKQRGRPKR